MLSSAAWLSNEPAFRLTSINAGQKFGEMLDRLHGDLLRAVVGAKKIKNKDTISNVPFVMLSLNKYSFEHFIKYIYHKINNYTIISYI